MKQTAIRRLAMIGGAVTLGVTSLLAVGAAQAQTGKGPSAPSGKDPVIAQFVKQVGPAAIRNQNALSYLRAWLIAQPGFARSGYVGSIDNLAHRAMTVMWYGPRTPLLTALIREGARRGIAVGVQHRKYSLQQLNAATAAIWKQAAADQWTGFKVSAIAAVSATETGLTVEGTYTKVPAARRAPQVRSLATVVDGVPVHVVPGHSVSPRTLHGRSPVSAARAMHGRVLPGHPVAVDGARYSDYVPFSGGGLMRGYYTKAWCSSGFSISINGTPHSITAYHCDDGNAAGDYVAASYANGPHPPPTSRWYGKYGPASTDGAGLVLGNKGFYSMFNHGWSSTTTANDIGYQDLAVNDLVCTEGGNSGEHCNVKVTDLEVTIDLNDGYGPFATILAYQQTPGAIASMGGDSGGPVMALYNTSAGQVRAAGMIQAGTNANMNCGPSYVSAPCGIDVYFTSMRTIVDGIPGASLLTG
jgi:hypothetical protein